MLQYFFPVIGGILLSLCFPRFNLGFLAYFGFSILLFVIGKCKNYTEVFKKCLIYGLTFHIILLYWIVPTIIAAGEHWSIAVVALLLLALYLSVFFSIYGIFIFRFLEKTYLFFISGVTWVVLEYIKNYLLSGFPWMLLGYSQWNFPQIIQISEITGVYGVSFLLVIINAAIYQLIKKNKIQPVIITTALFLICLLFGIYRMDYGNLYTEKKLRVAMLQGSIDQYKKWDRKYVEEIKTIYSNLALETLNPVRDPVLKDETRPIAYSNGSCSNLQPRSNNCNGVQRNEVFCSKGVNNRADLIIWPESSVPGYLFAEKNLFEWIKTLVKKTRTYHLIGSLDVTKDFKIYNSCFLFSPEFVLLGDYDKIHLTPFGETVPLKEVLSKIAKVLETLGGISPGKEFTVFELDNDIKFSVFICFESIFPELVREFVKSGAELLVNITNDAWFLKTSAPEQHFINCVFRAVENRKFVVRVGNTGISGIIDPYGRVIMRTKLFDRRTFLGAVSCNNKITFYTSVGDIFAKFCIITLIIVILKERFITKCKIF